ncbi:wd40 repeat family [Anaeramoeba ignava]|uniref:Wd40 repeat family n=1 Tax=Anaeramoeba ignava TaxID=1746090 RepID=A0A9Q0LIM7_ANAIG|nr:wd40 repeat family [Anaeramoeba ignava]
MQNKLTGRLWRKNIDLESNEFSSDIKIRNYTNKQRFSQLTSFAIHSQSDYLLKSSFNSTKNESSIIEIFNKNRITDEMEIVYRFALNQPVYDMNWMDSRLLVASKGTAHLFELSKEFLDKISIIEKQGYNREELCGDLEEKGCYKHKHLGGRLLSAPPGEKNSKFLTIENNNLHIWDLNNSQDPLNTAQVSASCLYVSEYNPLMENIVIVGGVGSSIKIIDSRNISSHYSMIQNIENSKHDIVNDIQWSPFLPFVFASAGEDFTVKVWDMRFIQKAKPVYILEGHENIVDSICWSHFYPDFLFSSSLDHNVNFWSLNSSPNCLLSSQKIRNETIAGIACSRNSSEFVYLASKLNTVFSIQISEDFLSSLARNVLLKIKDRDMRTIHNCIFYRDFRQASNLVLSQSKNSIKQNHPKKALEITKLLRPLVLADFKQTPLRSVFWMCAVSIPPLFPFDWTQSVDSNFLFEKKLISLEAKLQLMIQQENFTGISKYLPKVQDFLLKLDFSTVSNMVEILSKTDIILAISLVISYGEQANDTEHSNFLNLAYPLIFPTVYDDPNEVFYSSIDNLKSEEKSIIQDHSKISNSKSDFSQTNQNPKKIRSTNSNTQDSNSQIQNTEDDNVVVIDESLRNLRQKKRSKKNLSFSLARPVVTFERILSQLKIMKNVHTFLGNNYSPPTINDHDTALSLFQDPLNLISITMLRLYLFLLLQKFQIIPFYIIASSFADEFSQAPIALLLQEMMSTIGFSILQKVLKKSYSQKISKRIIDIRNSLECAIEIATKSALIPKPVATFFQQVIPQFSSDLRNSLKDPKLVSDPSFANIQSQMKISLEKIHQFDFESRSRICKLEIEVAKEVLKSFLSKFDSTNSNLN